MRSSLKARRTGAAVLSLGVVAACSAAAVGNVQAHGRSGSSTVRPAPTSAAAVAPSPKVVASEFWFALAKGQLSDICRYVVPKELGDCSFTFKYASGGVEGAGIGNDFVDGQRALVVLTAKQSCWGLGDSTTTTSCFSNANPNRGLPRSDAGFAAAWQNGYFLFGLVACSEVDGRWYVDLDS